MNTGGSVQRGDAAGSEACEGTARGCGACGIDLLRHGDTGQRSYRGRLDDALSALGWQQLHAAVAGGEWDAVVASSLQRCAAFAQALCRARGLPLRLDPRLVEYDFGRWQGVPIETIAQQEGDALGRFWADPVAHPPPGAEPFAAFAARLAAALDDIAAQARGRRVLVVTHGGAIRLLRCRAEGRHYGDMAGIDVPHASLHRLHWPSPHGTRRAVEADAAAVSMVRAQGPAPPAAAAGVATATAPLSPPVAASG